MTWLIATKAGYGCTLWTVYVNDLALKMYPDCQWYGDLLMKKRTPRESSGEIPANLAAVETEVMARCLALVEHCAATRYDDGTARKPGWWTVRTRGSSWEIEIKDPDTCSRLVVIQTNLDDALALAQALLTADDAPWEPDPWLRQQETRKKK